MNIFLNVKLFFFKINAGWANLFYMNEKINDDYDRLSRAEERVREAFVIMREGILTELNAIETVDTTRQLAAAGGRILDYQNKIPLNEDRLFFGSY